MERMVRNVKHLSQLLESRHWKLATAESCTGGLLAAACTDVAGASAWFERGFVTYSNESKMEMLGVSAQILATEGAVSQAVAHAMAQGALARSQAQVAVAVTGIAGPTGGSDKKPVGTVWFGLAVNDKGTTRVETTQRQFPGDRSAIREASVGFAIALVLSLI
jgi:nicotinamide-nucleotide amidase